MLFLCLRRCVCFARKVPIRFQGKCKPSRCIIHFDVLGNYIYGELLIFFFFFKDVILVPIFYPHSFSLIQSPLKLNVNMMLLEGFKLREENSHSVFFKSTLIISLGEESKLPPASGTTQFKRAEKSVQALSVRATLRLGTQVNMGRCHIFKSNPQKAVVVVPFTY